VNTDAFDERYDSPHVATPPPRIRVSSAPYNDQQVASAKANVCAAFDQVQHAVNLANTHVEAPITRRNSPRRLSPMKHSMPAAAIC